MVKIIALGIVCLIGLYVVWMMIKTKEIKDVHINATAYKLKKDKTHGSNAGRKNKHNSRSTGKAQQGARKHGKSAKTNSRLSKRNVRTSTKD
jgi:ABC-type nickel/cobalt efflux system permease component RcnA